MADKDKQSYFKGYNDAKKPTPGVVSVLVSGTNFRPPRGQKEAYKAGWDRAKSEK